MVHLGEKADSCGKNYFSIYGYQEGAAPVFKATIQQSVLGKKCKLYDDNENVLLKAKNGNIRFADLLLPCLLCCHAWRLEFYKPGHSEDKVLMRDQGEGIVTVAPGESPLMAICVAYAIDKFLTPWSIISEM
jgi:hypothetical protein